MKHNYTVHKTGHGSNWIGFGTQMTKSRKFPFYGFKIGYIDDKQRNQKTKRKQKENKNENENKNDNNSKEAENDEPCVVFCKMADILGVYIDLELNEMKLYHNNTFIANIKTDFTCKQMVYPTLCFGSNAMCKYNMNFLPKYPFKE